MATLTSEASFLSAPDQALYHDDDEVDEEEAGMLQKAVASWVKVRAGSLSMHHDPSFIWHKSPSGDFIIPTHS